MTTLVYRSFVDVEDLALGECTIHRARNSDGATWWNLWWYVARETDGQAEAFCVPVIPHGSYTEQGPGGRSWGLSVSGEHTWQISPSMEHTWQISPSINVLDDEGARQAQAGEHPTAPSLWHQTPAIVNVPDGEVWAAT